MKKWFAGVLVLLVVPALSMADQDKKPALKSAKTKPQAKPSKRAPQAKPQARKASSPKVDVPVYNLDSPSSPLPPKKTALRRIISNQVIRVCVRTDVPPFGYFSNTGLTGFDVALSKALAVQMSIFYKKNLHISWVAINASARVSSLQKGHCDIVIAAFSYTAKRAKQVAFSKRYLKTDKVIISNANITRKVPVIALVKGTTNTAKGLKGSIKRFNNYKEIIFAMENGSVDYVTTDRPIAQHMMRSVTRPFNMVKELPQSELYGVGVNKANTHLLKAVNRALGALAKSGRLAYLHRQWL